MPAPTHKLFRGWFGAVLGEYLDRELPLPPEGLTELMAFSSAVPLREGSRVVLTARVMSVLLRCDAATVANWIDGRTIASTDKLPLFFAHFPAPCVEYALRHLDGLRVTSAGSKCISRMRRETAAFGSAAASLVETVVSAADDDVLDDAEVVATHQATAQLRAQLDRVDADATACSSDGKPRDGSYPRSARATG